MKKKKLLFATLLSSATVLTAFSQELISDIRTGMDGSGPQFTNAVQKDGNLYFIATPESTSALYKTNGTTAGTQKLIGNGTEFFATYILDFIGDELLFWGGNFTDGTALYKTDVSGSYTLVKTFSTQPFGSYLTPFIKVGNIIYFIGNDDVNGYELWKTDGTTVGTALVKDINPGYASSFLTTNFTALGNTIFFNAGDSAYGAELWKSDGTEAGTVMVKDIEPNNSMGLYYFGSNPTFLTTLNDKVYFSAYRALDGRELWESDGTEGGTQLVKDLNTGDSNPSELTLYNNQLYFIGRHTEGNVLYKTDGTHAGTNPVKLPSQGGAEIESKLAIFKNKLAFLGTDNNSNSYVWLSDGTASGTNKISNESSSLSFFYDSQLLPTTNHLYFLGMDNTGSGNTKLCRIADEGDNVYAVTEENFNLNTIEPLVLLNGCVMVVGNNGSTGDEPYKICNSTVVGIEDVTTEEKLNVMVYPNPLIDIVTIEGTTAEKYTVSIYSVIGISVFQEKFNGKTTVDLSHFPAGVYTAVIQQDSDRKSTMRIIKE